MNRANGLEIEFGNMLKKLKTIVNISISISKCSKIFFKFVDFKKF